MSPAVEQFVRALLRQMDGALAEMGTQELSQLVSKAKPPVKTRAGDRAVVSRWQDPVIERTIAESSRVLDLGCGDGQLLARLIHQKRVRGQGIELEAEAVFGCIERGVPVLQSDLDEGLKGFSDDSFDYVVLEETLQTLHRPQHVLGEMLRVGRTGIVSFPNFGYWQVRLDLAIRGRMPVTGMLPYRWYDTPNIHLLTLQDFRDWEKEKGARVVAGHALAGGKVRPLAEKDSLYAEEVLLVVEKI